MSAFVAFACCTGAKRRREKNRFLSIQPSQRTRGLCIFLSYISTREILTQVIEKYSLNVCRVFNGYQFLLSSNIVLNFCLDRCSGDTNTLGSCTIELAASRPALAPTSRPGHCLPHCTLSQQSRSRACYCFQLTRLSVTSCSDVTAGRCCLKSRATSSSSTSSAHRRRSCQPPKRASVCT